MPYINGISNGNVLAQKGVTHYNAQLKLPDKGGAIKRLDVWMSRSLRPANRSGPRL